MIAMGEGQEDEVRAVTGAEAVVLVVGVAVGGFWIVVSAGRWVADAGADERESMPWSSCAEMRGREATVYVVIFWFLVFTGFLNAALFVKDMIATYFVQDTLWKGEVSIDRSKYDVILCQYPHVIGLKH